MKPRRNRKQFLTSLAIPAAPRNSFQLATVSITVGAINASVEELAAPTNEMNKSSLGIAAANPTEIKMRLKVVNKSLQNPQKV